MVKWLHYGLYNRQVFSVDIENTFKKFSHVQEHKPTILTQSQEPSVEIGEQLSSVNYVSDTCLRDLGGYSSFRAVKSSKYNMVIIGMQKMSTQNEF